MYRKMKPRIYASSLARNHSKSILGLESSNTILSVMWVIMYYKIFY